MAVELKQEKLTEGWQAEKHDSQRVYHFIGKDTRSLCLKLGFYTGELMAPVSGAAKGREDCAECFRRLTKRTSLAASGLPRAS